MTSRSAVGLPVRREAALAVLAGVLLAVLLKWPVLRHLRTAIPADLGDPLLQSWQLSWGAHALLHAPAQIWNTNTFFPLPNTLAFSDSLLGYAPLGVLFGDGPTAALVRYNVIFVLSYALAFTAMYALARQLGTSRLAAALAGIGYAYAPWHLAQQGHLQILSDGGIPLALALLARGHGYGRSQGAPARPGLALAGWAVAAWQVSLGFGLGLQLGYLLGVLVALYGGRYLWARRRGTAPTVTRRLLLADLAGMALFLAVAATFAGPYLQVVRDHPEARRTVADLQLFSPPLAGFLTAPAQSWLWGPHQTAQREALPFQPEMTLAPGGALVLLAAVGATLGCWPRRRRLAMGVGAGVTLTLALGTQLAGGRYSYLLAFHYLPGWDGIRTPGRLVVTLTVLLALLAAAGVDRLRALAGPGRQARDAVVAAALLVVLVETLGSTDVPVVPALPAALDRAAGPLLVLPTDTGHDNAAMFWSTAGLYPIANGNSGFTPRQQDALQTGVTGFPDAASVALLRRVGIRQVVLLPEDAAGTPWQGAQDRPVSGLGVQRRQVGAALVYDLDAVG